MRVLYYSDKGEENSSLLHLKNNKLAIVDFTDDVEEAEYCLYVRKYDLVIIDTTEKFIHIATLLRLTNDELAKNDFMKLIFNNSNLNVTQIEQYIKMKYNKTESLQELDNLLNDIYPNSLNQNGISLNINKNNSIAVSDGIEEYTINLSKMEFQLIVYFLRHYGEKIHMDRLLSAISEDPEFIRKTTVESAISEIKKKFKKSFDITPITNFKKVGYLFKTFA